MVKIQPSSGARLDVVVPIHNEQGWIGSLLTSFGAPIDDVIVHLVLSACTDRSERICAAWACDRGKAVNIVEEKRRGVAYARNQGASAGRSPWILFIDADVVVPQSFLRAVLEVCDKTQSDLAGFPFHSDRDSLLLRFGTKLTMRYFKLLTKLGRPSIPGFAFLIRRVTFERAGGFDEHLAIAEDLDLCERVGRAGGNVEWLSKPSVEASTRRFSHQRTRLLVHYIRTEAARLLFRRKYYEGDVIYEFGSHDAPSRGRG